MTLLSVVLNCPAMSTERPQFYQNKLKPVDITPDSLRRVLQELRTAARHGADLVQHGSPPTDDWGSKGMFSDAPGMVLPHYTYSRHSVFDMLTG